MAKGGSQPVARPTPSVFISYSWDSPEHTKWVLSLAERLVNNGVEVFIDQWHVRPGDSITQFMEDKVSSCDHVLIICTPNYAQRSMKRTGGVGYEQQIISGGIAAGVDRSKFIPVIRAGTFEPGKNAAIPPHLMGVLAVDLRKEADFDLGLENLLRTIFNEPGQQPPVLGPAPNFEDAEEADEDVPPPGRLPRIDSDGWELFSAEERAAAHPDTFIIASAEERASVAIGDSIKLGFDFEPDETGFAGERMWARVIGFDGPYIVALWTNQALASDYFPALSWGRPVLCLPEHILDILSQEEMAQWQREELERREAEQQKLVMRNAARPRANKKSKAKSEPKAKLKPKGKRKPTSKAASKSAKPQSRKPKQTRSAKRKSKR